MSLDGQRRIKERVFKVDDELPDCCRYACMLYPEMPTPIENGVAPVRKLDDLPENVRWAVERERRLGAWTAESAESGVSDFYTW